MKDIMCKRCCGKLKKVSEIEPKYQCQGRCEYWYNSREIKKINMKKPTSIKDILDNVKLELKEYDIEILSNHGNQDDEEVFNEIIRQQITELLEHIILNYLHH